MGSEMCIRDSCIAAEPMETERAEQMSVRLDDVATIDFFVPSSVVTAERENAPRARRVSGTRGLDEAVFVHDKDAREAPDLRAPQDASPGPPASGDSPGDRAGPSGGEAGLGPGARDAPPVFLKFPIDAALTRDQRLASSSRASPLARAALQAPRARGHGLSRVRGGRGPARLRRRGGDARGTRGARGGRVLIRGGAFRGGRRIFVA